MRCPKYRSYLASGSLKSAADNISDYFGTPDQLAVPKNISQELIEELILKFFVSGNIPLLQVENEHLHALISLIKINGKNAHTQIWLPNQDCS